MDLRRVLTGLGAGVTTFLLVAVLVIESLAVEFSAIVGLPVGVLAGLAVGTALWIRIPHLSRPVRRMATAYATFGLTILVLLASKYVNIGQDVLSISVIAGIALAGAAGVYLALWLVAEDII